MNDDKKIESKKDFNVRSNENKKRYKQAQKMSVGRVFDVTRC